MSSESQTVLKTSDCSEIENQSSPSESPISSSSILSHSVGFITNNAMTPSLSPPKPQPIEPSFQPAVHSSWHYFPSASSQNSNASFPSSMLNSQPMFGTGINPIASFSSTHLDTAILDGRFLIPTTTSSTSNDQLHYLASIIQSNTNPTSSIPKSAQILQPTLPMPLQISPGGSPSNERANTAPSRFIPADEQASPSRRKTHKVRIKWTRELHQKFLRAIKLLGPTDAIPSKIVKVMGVEGLSRDHVSSHLQKHRLSMKRRQQLRLHGVVKPTLSKDETESNKSSSCEEGGLSSDPDEYGSDWDDEEFEEEDTTSVSQ